MVISSGTCAAAELDQVNSTLASKQPTSVSTRRRSPVPEFCDSRIIVVVVPGDSSSVSAFTRGIAAGSKPVVESKSISSRHRTATLSSNWRCWGSSMSWTWLLITSAGDRPTRCCRIRSLIVSSSSRGKHENDSSDWCSTLVSKTLKVACNQGMCRKTNKTFSRLPRGHRHNSLGASRGVEIVWRDGSFMHDPGCTWNRMPVKQTATCKVPSITGEREREKSGADWLAAAVLIVRIGGFFLSVKDKATLQERRCYECSDVQEIRWKGYEVRRTVNESSAAGDRELVEEQLLKDPFPCHAWFCWMLLRTRSSSWASHYSCSHGCREYRSRAPLLICLL